MIEGAVRVCMQSLALNRMLDLGLASDDGIELALLRLLRQVAAELVEKLRGLRLLPSRSARSRLAAAGA